MYSIYMIYLLAKLIGARGIMKYFTIVTVKISQWMKIIGEGVYRIEVGKSRLRLLKIISKCCSYFNGSNRYTICVGHFCASVYDAEDWTLAVFVYTLKFYRSVRHLNVLGERQSCHIFVLYVVQMICAHVCMYPRIDLKMISVFLNTHPNRQKGKRCRIQFFGFAQVSYVSQC